MVLNAGKAIRHLWCEYEDAKIRATKPAANVPVRRTEQPYATGSAIVVEHDAARLDFDGNGYRLTMRRILRNTGTDPITRYLIRISVDRYPGEPERSNAHCRAHPLTWDELAITAVCRGEDMRWQTKHDRDAFEEIWLLFENEHGRCGVQAHPRGRSPVCVKFPVALALAQLVPALPTGPGWWYEIKLDGHRTVLWRLADTVRLQTRAGRDVTASWMDLALPRMDLPPGVVLDGEAVIVEGGRISYRAVQSRAASTPDRARALSETRPALFIVGDVLALPTGEVRGRSYAGRRAMLLEVRAGLPSPSPTQAVSATDDLGVAQSWSESFVDWGVEGVVAKLGTSPRRAGPSSAVAEARGGDGGRVPCHRGPYGSGGVAPGLRVEVLVGTTRHAVVTVTGLR
ncbi:hypothetical protein GCM10010254_75220 [Streptomyces chromofuscus]|nr:hypothetical protein GCM10010254_75220 [Streptomyces chromofuscus]